MYTRHRIHISDSYKYSDRQVLFDPIAQVERLRLSGVREHAQGHTAAKMLKRDVDPLRLALRPLLLHEAASQSVFSNYILIIHILTISSPSDVMGFGL